MNSRVLFILALILPLTLSQSLQNIIIGDLAATIVLPGPKLFLLPLEINSTAQLWNVTSDGYIHSAHPGYTNYVFDVAKAVLTNNTGVIVYPRKAAASPNQRWNVSNAGVITSALSSTLTLNALIPKTGDGTLVVSIMLIPRIFIIQVPPICVYFCQSVGDPHIAPFCANDAGGLWSKGAQLHGTYVLLSQGEPHHPDYVVIQASHQPVATMSGAYISKGAAMNISGNIIQIWKDSVVINGFGIAIKNKLTIPGTSIVIVRQYAGLFIVNYPFGIVTVEYHCCDWLEDYVNIIITVTGGKVPKGVCSYKHYGVNISPFPPVAFIPTPTDLFLWSWRVPSWNYDLFAYETHEQWLVNNPDNFNISNGITNADPNLLASAQQACAPLASGALFTACNPTIPALEFYDSCLFDAVAAQNTAVAGTIIDSYASRCGLFSPSSNIPKLTSGFKSTAEGPGVDVITSPPSWFVITARDTNGSPVGHGNDQFTVGYTGGPGILSFTQTDLGNGTYYVSYSATKYGMYQISVMLKGVHLADSPFTVKVANPCVSGTHECKFYQTCIADPDPSDYDCVLTPNKWYAFDNGTVGGDGCRQSTNDSLWCMQPFNETRQQHIELPAFDLPETGYAVEVKLLAALPENGDGWTRVFELASSNSTGHNIFFGLTEKSSSLTYKVYDAPSKNVTRNVTYAYGAVGRMILSHGADTTVLIAWGDEDGQYRNDVLPYPSNVSRDVIYVGRSTYQSNSYLNGKIGEIRIWSAAQTWGKYVQHKEEYLDPQATTYPNLIAVYRADKVCNSTWIDLTGNGRHAVLVNFDQADLFPSCYGRGTCVDGECVCQRGYSGLACEQH